MPKGTRATTLLFLALAAILTGIAGSGVVSIGLSEAGFFGVGGALAVMLVAGSSRHRLDGLDPARLQLAQFRRSGHPVDVLLVKLPTTSAIAGRRPSPTHARAVPSVLRVTDGVSIVPSLSGKGLCAVVGSDGQTRTAIERRVRRVCGGEIQIAWASSPEDGVTLDSLLEAALNRLRGTESGRRRRPTLRPLPVRRLLPGVLGAEREPMRTAR